MASGSEKHITPETAWMEKQGYRWTESEEDVKETIPTAEETDGEGWDEFSA